MERYPSSVKEAYDQFGQLYSRVEQKDEWSYDEVSRNKIAGWFLKNHLDVVLQKEDNIRDMAYEMIQSVEFWKENTLVRDKNRNCEYVVAEHFPDFGVEDLYVTATAAHREASLQANSITTPISEIDMYKEEAEFYKKYELVAGVALGLLQKDKKFFNK